VNIPSQTLASLKRALALHAEELAAWAPAFDACSDDTSLACQLLRHIDESDYSLEEWVDALAGLKAHLPSGIEVSPRRALGYLHCVQMTIDPTLARPPLREATLELFEEYGIDPATGED
jgi:hypothetical protein